MHYNNKFPYILVYFTNLTTSFPWSGSFSVTCRSFRCDSPATNTPTSVSPRHNVSPPEATLQGLKNYAVLSN